MKRLLSVTAIAAGIIATCSTVNASTRTSALVCQNLGTPALMSAYGWYNVDTNLDLHLWCGLSTQTGASSRAVSMRVYDRNANSNVTCEVFGMDANGGFPFHETLSSSGSQSAAQVISSQNPIPSSVLFYSAYCTVPPDKGTGQSFVTEFIVD